MEKSSGPSVRHKLLERDPVTLTGTCQVCGPVVIRRRINEGRVAYRCAIARSAEYRHRTRRGEPGRHGLSIDEARSLRTGGACEVCGTTEDLHVDHDHLTGKIRGILCLRHNMGVGYFSDDPDALEAAAAYLRRARV